MPARWRNASLALVALALAAPHAAWGSRGLLSAMPCNGKVGVFKTDACSK